MKVAIRMLVFTAGFLLVAGPALAGSDTVKVYDSKCATCHAKDGSGDTPIGKKMKLRDLRSAEVQKLSDDQLYKITAEGQGKMPGYAKKLSADEIRGLVQYIRDLAKKK